MSPQDSQLIPRPFLKWAGGKSKLILQYIPYLPQKIAAYYEPFLGGGAIFFYLCSKDTTYGFSRGNFPANLSDVNPELINAYCCVRDHIEELISLLEEHQLRHTKDYYYQMRSTLYLKSLTPQEKAARLIYLNKTCFNGLYRENSKSEFNVPIGKYKNPKICNPDLLRTVSAHLQSAKIEVRPFETILDRAHTAQDCVYFDPPYYPLSATSNFTAYSRYSFNEDDQIKLRDTFAVLAKRGVKVMLSNSDCPFIRELYSEFNIHEISAARAINSDANKRGKITELLITSY